MAHMSVTLEMSKLSGWLKSQAESNMLRMLVTRDVSKLSGWLKETACCRVEREACVICGAKCLGRETRGCIERRRRKRLRKRRARRVWCGAV